MLGDFKLKAYFFRTLTYNQITLMSLLYISATLNKYEMLQEVYTYKVSQCLLPVADPGISNRGGGCPPGAPMLDPPLPTVSIKIRKCSQTDRIRPIL